MERCLIGTTREAKQVIELGGGGSIMMSRYRGRLEWTDGLKSEVTFVMAGRQTTDSHLVTTTYTS